MVKTHDSEPVWDKPPDVDEKWIKYIDENVLVGKLLLSSTIAARLN